MIKRLENMKETLMNCVQGQMGDLASVDSKEMGEAIDMIKDLSEAIYYCTVTEAMHENKKEYPVYYRDMDRENGIMYYTDSHGVYHPSANTTTGSQVRRDYREGRSPMTRKMYMEHKELHHGKEAQIQELEKYVQELSQDVMEMIDNASSEEKQILKNKLSTLASKIV